MTNSSLVVYKAVMHIMLFIKVDGEWVWNPEYVEERDRRIQEARENGGWGT